MKRHLEKAHAKATTPTSQRPKGMFEGLHSQGFPNEEVAARRYEIMQKFIEGERKEN